MEGAWLGCCEVYVYVLHSSAGQQEMFFQVHYDEIFYFNLIFS